MWRDGDLWEGSGTDSNGCDRTGGAGGASGGGGGGGGGGDWGGRGGSDAAHGWDGEGERGGSGGSEDDGVRGGERGGERDGERGGERDGERGGERDGDLGGDRGGERGCDGGGDCLLVPAAGVDTGETLGESSAGSESERLGWRIETGGWAVTSCLLLTITWCPEVPSVAAYSRRSASNPTICPGESPSVLPVATRTRAPIANLGGEAVAAAMRGRLTDLGSWLGGGAWSARLVGDFRGLPLLPFLNVVDRTGGVRPPRSAMSSTAKEAKTRCIASCGACVCTTTRVGRKARGDARKRADRLAGLPAWRNAFIWFVEPPAGT